MKNKEYFVLGILVFVFMWIFLIFSMRYWYSAYPLSMIVPAVIAVLGIVVFYKVGKRLFKD